jgi:RimJ/RimL family protein N-acetyltransferase
VELREPPALTTERLLLRGFQQADLEPLTAMNADPAVMRYLGGARTPESSAASVEQCRRQWDQRGFGRLAIEDRDSGEFVGWVTLEPVEHDRYADDIEIGWRLTRRRWGQGLATEAATALLNWAFASLPVDRVLAIADVGNDPSVSVMRKLGMVHLADVPDDGGTSTVWYARRATGGLE